MPYGNGDLPIFEEGRRVYDSGLQQLLRVLRQDENSFGGILAGVVSVLELKVRDGFAAGGVSSKGAVNRGSTSIVIDNIQRRIWTEQVESGYNVGYAFYLSRCMAHFRQTF